MTTLISDQAPAPTHIPLPHPPVPPTPPPGERSVPPSAEPTPVAEAPDRTSTYQDQQERGGALLYKLRHVIAAAGNLAVGASVIGESHTAGAVYLGGAVANGVTHAVTTIRDRRRYAKALDTGVVTPTLRVAAAQGVKDTYIRASNVVARRSHARRRARRTAKTT